MTFVTLKTNPQALIISKKVMFRSTAYALAAYYYSLILEKFLMMTGAVINGFTTSIDYQGVEVMVDPKAWNQEAVLMIYLVPFLVQAVLVILIYINRANLQVTPGYTMIFIHWVILFITFRLTAMIPIQLLFKTGIYHAFSWLYLGTAMEVIISVAGIFIFAITTRWMLRGVLFFSATLNDQYRVTGLSALIRSSLLIPVILICVIPGLYYLPSLPKDEITGLFVIMVISAFTILRLLYGRHEQLPKGEKVKEKFNPVLLFPIVLVFIVILRVILGIGIII
jgi:hypothetical protein